MQIPAFAGTNSKEEEFPMTGKTAVPPNGLPRYRLLTGPDDATFCKRVSEMLDMGYVLYGSPALTHNGASVIAAQALLWPSD